MLLRHSDGRMWISLWNPCACFVQISAFHAQDSARPIRRFACRRPRAPRSFSRSVRVPREADATPRRPSRVLRPPADSGGETVSARGTQVPRRLIEQPEPGARDSQGSFKPCPPGAARRWVGLAMRRTEWAASAPRPALPGRPVSAPKDGDGRLRRTDPRGNVRARGGIAARGLFAEAGDARTAKEREARWTAQNGRFRGKAGFAKSRAATGRRTAFPRRDAGRGGRTAARSPWGSGPKGSRNVRRLLRIGSQAGSRGVRRCLAGHSRGPLPGTGQPDASILYGAANRRSSPFSRPFPGF